jgi:hypothetical protein
MNARYVLCLAMALMLIPGTLRSNKRDDIREILVKIQSYPASLGPGISEYNATEYTKFLLHAKRSNSLIDLLPSLFKLRWGKQDYIAESQNELHFVAPDTWNRKNVAIVGTLPKLNDIQHLANDYLNISVYGRTLLEDRMLSPLHPKNRNYYYYHLENVMRHDDRLLIKLRFKAKTHNPQLINGYAWINWKTGAIGRIYFRGKYDLVDIETTAVMGKDSLLSLLPLDVHIQARLKFLKNKLDGEYNIQYQYKDIKEAQDTILDKDTKKRHDLTRQYILRTDTAAFKNSLADFEPLRPTPLTPAEKDIYQKNQLVKMQNDTTSKKSKKGNEFWGALGDALLDRHELNLQQAGKLRVSPIITPAMLQYSQRRGISLKTNFSYSKLFPDGQLFRTRFKIGYNFKEKQVYWSLPTSFEYAPRHRAALSFNVGNGSHIYSSELVDKLKQDVHGRMRPDSLVKTLDSLRLGIYRDLFFQLDNRFDICTGLTLNMGIIYHKRSIVNKNNIVVAENIVNGSIKKSYKSFAPHAKLIWTPCLYYYWNGREKKELYSNYPTFTVDYERGIKLGDCKMEYSRWEFGTEYHIKLWKLRSIWLRSGGGFYDMTKDTYFVDFSNFTYRSLPDGWADDLSGQFQLLRSQFYNSSSYYTHFCMTYESPMMIFTRIKYLTNYIQTERIYLNTLMVDQLHPYIECGYGIGTMLFNAGAYISFANGHYDAIGIRIAFELFR